MVIPLVFEKEKVLGGQEIVFMVGQYSGGSGAHLTLIHPWLNISNSFSMYGLLLHSNFIPLPAKLRGLRDDIATKVWRVLMSQLPWKLLVSPPCIISSCTHNFTYRGCREISQREWQVLGTEEKGDLLQIIWRWCLQGTREQTEGLTWHPKFSKEANHLLPFLLKQSIRKT